MRVAAIYDIHGNLPALEAVLEEVRREDVEHVVVGGDVVPGPLVRETLACLLALDVPVRFIQGNCEVAVVNAGSVGMPFGEPGADWLLLGPDVELRHTDYDGTTAAARLRGTDYPDAQEFVTQYVLQQPSAAEMLDLFTRVSLRGGPCQQHEHPRMDDGSNRSRGPSGS